MTLTDIVRSRRWRWGIFISFWTLLGLSFASQFYISSAKTGRPVSWGQALSFSLGDWYVFALLSIPANAAGHRWSFTRPNVSKWPTFLVHLGCSILFSVVYVMLRTWLAQWQGSWTGGTLSFGEAFGPVFIKTFHFNLLIYWVIIGVTHGFTYYQKYHERELRASELERRLAEAKLQALQMQLNPHFLFNALHSISALMHRDVEAADEMIARLSDLLRTALDNTDAQEVPLEQELEFLQRYLAIEQIRFGDRLTVSMNIDPGTLDALVPNLILQPLVENAIKHGIEPHARMGVVTLESKTVDGQLHLRVADNGGGLKKNGREGIGVSNTKARLEQLYGNEHKFILHNGLEHGVEAEISIPWRKKE